MDEVTHEALMALLDEVIELKKGLATHGAEIEQLQSELHEHKTNSHAKGCWF